jgi:hypothetical protein
MYCRVELEGRPRPVACLFVRMYVMTKSKHSTLPRDGLMSNRVLLKVLNAGNIKFSSLLGDDFSDKINAGKSELKY